MGSQESPTPHYLNAALKEIGKANLAEIETEKDKQEVCKKTIEPIIETLFDIEKITLPVAQSISQDIKDMLRVLEKLNFNKYEAVCEELGQANSHIATAIDLFDPSKETNTTKRNHDRYESLRKCRRGFQKTVEYLDGISD